ncbi:hypothetical protein [Cellulosilyticum ruminicola]|uniref:hypothetical protein n=1 Tax=Cellulosilyticum ruminicola TaxID=425254 RepID=UPI0006D0CF65|nr:hypothetical protein [Cellulosilyticum ruminicola]
MLEVTVFILSLAGIKKESVFWGFSKKLIPKATAAIIYGDLLTKVLYRVRPYEKVTGSAQALYEKWFAICKTSLQLNPIANNYLVQTLEKEGVEVVSSELLPLFLFIAYNYKYLDDSFKKHLAGKAMIQIIKYYQKNI